MFRSGRRYQKQIRDELRRQNARSTFIARASQPLIEEAQRIEARKKTDEAAQEESVADELERLGRLHDQRVLTAAEFEQAKRRVLNRPR